MVVPPAEGTVTPSPAALRVNDSDRETVIRDLLSGQYANPVRVVAF
jgi:hypothetical protein